MPCHSIKIIYHYFFYFSLILLIPGQISAQDLERHTFHSRHMGSQFSIILYAENRSEAEHAANAAFGRVEELNQIMSDYLQESELNLLSHSSGSGEFVEVSEELFEVLKEAVNISEISEGLFDATIGPMTRAWRMTRMMPEPELPDEDELSELHSRVDYSAILFDDETQSVKLKKENMQLDFGGIAKGYAAEEAVRVIQSHGFRSVLVDAGGDISLGDPPPGRDGWDVVVPKVRSGPDRSQILIRLSGKTLTTSGDMFQFIEIEGKRYSHIINPKTGLGSTARRQATVISSNGMYADAFASVLTLMEPEEGIGLINRLEETEAIIFMNTEEGIKEWMSSGFSRYIKEQPAPIEDAD